MAERTLYTSFTDTVARFPDAVALEVAGTALTYRELHERAEAVARRIVRTLGAAPARVGLLAMRSEAAYAGYLAALRLGAVVTPLNPRFPAARNVSTCSLAGLDVVLVDDAAGAGLDAEWAVHRVLELTGDPGADAEAELPPYAASPDDVAYLLFTSGSTGRPKGVPIRHRNVRAYLEHNIARYDVRPGDRVSHTFDLTFDPSVFDLFVTWAAGATLIVPQRTELLSPVDYVIEHGITHWFSVPSVVSVARQLGRLHTGVAKTLRHSMFIGEQCTLDQARAWREVAPGSRISNVYGPTELTVACAGYELPADSADWPETSNDTVPIGEIYPFLDWVVLGEDGFPATEGELVVRGVQRFAGYFDPVDDAGRFVEVDAGGARPYDGTGALTGAHYYRTGDRVRRENGTWVHLGRLDDQVKVRGYRIELGDIETSLRRHPDVDEAVVVAVAEAGDLVLTAFYTGAGADPAELTRWLRKRLPVHMVPREFRRLDAVPLNANGKADRPRLRRLLAA